MKRRFLVLYDYGQGGVWAYLLADSAEQIHREFPVLRIFDETPQWMTAEDVAKVASSMTIDVTDRDHPFLASLPER